MEFLLILTILVPLVGAGMVGAMWQAERHPVRVVALSTTLVTLALAAVLTSQYPTHVAGKFAVSEFDWLGSSDSVINLKFSLGLDGLSLWLFALSALLMVTAVLVSWNGIKDRPHGFYAALLLLETGLLGVFTAQDIILFYVFFEFTLVPLFFIIGIWGSEERRYAAIKFFLFTFAGSVITFLGLLAIVLWDSGHIGAGSAFSTQLGKKRAMTFSISELADNLSGTPKIVQHSGKDDQEVPRHTPTWFSALDKDSNEFLTEDDFSTESSSMNEQNGKDVWKRACNKLGFKSDVNLSWDEIKSQDATLQLWIFLALFVGFAIKAPLFPFHTWLPLAHVQAPVAGSVLLAGVLLKIGVYGFVRFSLPMLPEATAVCMPWMLWLAVAGIIYGALVALAQSDIKRLIAYSSVSHLGFCMLGIFALNKLGLEGGVLQMINHGLSTGGLFAIVGMIYERYHTRKIAELGGLAKRMPILAFFMLIFTFSSIGLPGLNGFTGEFLLLTGMFQRAWLMPGAYGSELIWIAVLSVSGVVLGAWYMLFLVQRTFFGPLREPVQEPGSPKVKDLGWIEISALTPLVVFVFWIGLQPNFFLARMNSTLDPLAEQMERAVRNEYQSNLSKKQISTRPGAISSPIDGKDSLINSQTGKAANEREYTQIDRP